ncbi:hypothetical protein J2X05_000545 [Cellvibrio fibrivorans]|uniref:Uncharacterized protein n=1 Tax=Cellvibrio fibrivorans TaxID=126350 RepID=A0ABU1UTN7_9GAMM|nr:hypothetical protein [Cellvibrio fibrivorans]
MRTWIFSQIDSGINSIYMIFIEFMKLACSVQNRPRVRNASQGRYENPLCAGEEVGFCCSDFYLGSISGVSRASRCGDFFQECKR